RAGVARKRHGQSAWGASLRSTCGDLPVPGGVASSGRIESGTLRRSVPRGVLRKREVTETSPRTFTRRPMGHQEALGSTMRVTRRQFLAGTAAVAALGLPSHARAQAKPYAGQTLTLFTYAGAYESGLRKHLVPAFEQKTGARVVLDPGWWDMLPK